MAAPSRHHHSRVGFTLVELLVVITIIGMLVSLLLPAVQSAREAGRRNTCGNNMRQAALALMNYEGSRRSFPGYANVVNNKRASWVVTILPYLEQNNLYEIWQNTPPAAVATGVGGVPTPTFPNGSPWAYTELNILECPSNPTVDSTRNPLAFVVNAGSAKTANDNYPGGSNTWSEDANSGVFFNHCNADTQLAAVQYDPYNNPPSMKPAFVPNGPKTSTDFISTNDGTSNTLMMSENLQATTWATDPLKTDVTNPITPFQSDFQVKQATAFVWFITGAKNNATPVVNTSNFEVASMGINDNNSPGSALALQWAAGTPGGLAYSRPSSAHPGGVNTVFCDGHMRFISEEIAYNVYSELMTPKGKAALVPNGASGTQTTKAAGWNYFLNEADY